MKVQLSIERSLPVPASADEVLALFDDLETTIGRFPKLKKLSHLGGKRYRWDMDIIGSRIANIAHSVSYGAEYHINGEAGELRWTALPDVGNARIEGAFRVRESAEGATLSFQVRGELHDVPVPLVYRLVAPAFIQGKFTALVDRFLEHTRSALQEAPAAKKPARKKAAR
ncbi:MAG: hypothetical protein EPN60_07420 [Nevskiaceae bacterium]|nr:MAG: hypothetical protein EPO48_15570 [Nevskiaceae bacterium]TAM28233.1 MAG: hypothetical protein EPN60_07420 [Nevskiaceae bacterium]